MTTNAALENIYARRSVRAYTDQLVSEEMINEILKAGTFAPTGMNRQPLRFVIVTNRELMLRWSDLCKAWNVNFFKQQQVGADPTKAEALGRYIRMLSEPSNNIFHAAPLLVLVYAAPGPGTPMEDACLAAENMMLAARAMGLGSCWIGFAKPIPMIPEISTKIGAPADLQLVAQLVFGHPKGEFPKGARKEPVVLNRID